MDDGAHALSDSRCRPPAIHSPGVRSLGRVLTRRTDHTSYWGSQLITSPLASWPRVTYRVSVAARRQPQTKVRSELAKARIRRGLYQHELAVATGISIASYRRLERGELRSPPLWWFVNCAHVLNVKLETILDRYQRDWHPTRSAPRPPTSGFLKVRRTRASEWRASMSL